MTTPSYSVNSISVSGVQSSWQRVIKRKNSDGSIDFQPFWLNIWDIPKATMATFLQLQDLAGAAITSLNTNDNEDFDEAATYTTGEIIGVVDCVHNGTQAQNIRLEMRVSV